MFQGDDEKGAQPDRQQKQKPENPVSPEPIPPGKEKGRYDASESNCSGCFQPVHRDSPPIDD
jgi:hypothetical protein